MSAPWQNECSYISYSCWLLLLSSCLAFIFCLQRWNVSVPNSLEINQSVEAISSSKEKLPMGSDKVKKKMLWQRTAHAWSRQLSRVMHCIERAVSHSEHVLRGDGQDLASSCSYRSLLALLLLPCFPLITTDKGYTGLSQQWLERVALTRLSLREWAQVQRGVKGEKSITVLLCMLLLCFKACRISIN